MKKYGEKKIKAIREKPGSVFFFAHCRRMCRGGQVLGLKQGGVYKVGFTRQVGPSSREVRMWALHCLRV